MTGHFTERAMAAAERLRSGRIRDGDRAAIADLLVALRRPAVWSALPDPARSAVLDCVERLGERDGPERGAVDAAARRRAQVAERREAEAEAVTEAENVISLFGPRGSDEGPISHE